MIVMGDPKIVIVVEVKSRPCCDVGHYFTLEVARRVYGLITRSSEQKLGQSEPF